MFDNREAILPMAYGFTRPNCLQFITSWSVKMSDLPNSQKHTRNAELWVYERATGRGFQICIGCSAMRKGWWVETCWDDTMFGIGLKKAPTRQPCKKASQISWWPKKRNKYKNLYKIPARAKIYIGLILGSISPTWWYSSLCWVPSDLSGGA